MSNYKIRKITPDGVVTTFAGSGAMGAADGKGTMASFNLPIDVATDAKGNIYVADQGNKIRKITPDGVVSTLAGSGAQGDADGKGAAASFYDPTGIGLDASGNIYVADYGNNKIRKVTQQGVVTTLAGTGVFGSDNGSGASATFKGPHDVAVDSYGRIFVVEATDIRLIEIK